MNHTPARSPTPSDSTRKGTALASHRTLAFQATLSGQPDLALLVLLHALVADRFRRSVDTAAHIHGREPAYGPSMPKPEDSPAAQHMAEQRAAWEQRHPEEEEALWPWLVAQKRDAIMALLAFCVAECGHTGFRDWTGDGTGSSHHQIAAAAGLDVGKWWTATPETYFARVSKAVIANAVTGAAGDDTARRGAAMKKADAARVATEAVAGTGWLPSLLRTPPVE